jgi:hypothetical protein
MRVGIWKVNDEEVEVLTQIRIRVVRACGGLCKHEDAALRSGLEREPVDREFREVIELSQP